MKKKKSHGRIGFCPKNKTVACCGIQPKERDSENPFGELDVAVLSAWQAFVDLKPSVKDVKRQFAEKLLLHYLYQCVQIGLTANEIKEIFSEGFNRVGISYKTFVEVLEKQKESKKLFESDLA